MNTSFHKKLFVYISILMLLLTILCVTGFSLYTYNNMKNQSEENLNQLTLRTSTELQTLFNDMDKLSLYVSTNPNIMQEFKEAKVPGYPNSKLNNNIVKIITSISTPNSSSRFRISLYNENGNFISTGIPYTKSVASEKLVSPDYQNWYNKLPIIEYNSSLSTFHEDYWSNSNISYLSLYREIFDPYMIAGTVGIIDVQCPYPVIQQILSFETDDYDCFLFDSNGNAIFPSKAETPEQINLYQSYLVDQVSGKNHGTHRSVIYSGSVMENDWHLLLTQSQQHIFKVLMPQIFAIIFMGCAALAATLIMMFLITKRTTQPLRDLTASIKQVSFTNLSLEADSADYPDEISSLNQAFDKMFERLKQSMDEIVKVKAYEMQANMVALQSQMDPHFLFNILTIIKALSRENNTGQIAITCDYLVKMLRYISSYNEDSATLARELEHTEYYLELMKIRYEDQFTYSFYMDSDLDAKTLRIPKLSLQPLVENCFQHGFKRIAPPWDISINCWIKDDKWFLNVKDNGTGITDDDMKLLHEKINAFLSNPSDSLILLKIGGMGLVNTVARLKLKYKDDIIFKIENIPSGGTSVTLGGTLENEYLISRR